MPAHDQIAEAARGKLAADLGIPIEDIAVEAVEDVDWPDASLGLPEPGQMYIQMITPGFRITLKHGTERYVYHANQSGTTVRYNPRS